MVWTCVEERRCCPIRGATISCYKVTGKRKRGQPKRIWRWQVEEVIGKIDFKKEDAYH